ncbi:AMP-binding protein [Janibacter sp. DB-40]|uniref:class I adenylate-forming enzyme family protein n=1 Tax=Janibacter sp. DB-40 TaxID=3028808 RepID=UPI00240710D9|nr:AMP-binding protein [Janibacter sp. DB-40]
MAEHLINIGDELLRVGRADSIAIIDRDGPHTYAQLREAADAVGHSISEWNLDAGARIGLLSRNSLFWAAAYLAILRSGHVAVPFATNLTVSDIRARARFVDCDAFVLDTGLKRLAEGVAMEARHVVDESVLSAPHHRGDTTRPVDPDEDAVLMFTSGTTSAPRAVRVSHRNIRANTDSIVEYLGLTADDRVLVVLPFTYCYGASLLHTHLSVGASLSVCDTFTFPETVIETIRRDACTGLAGVPSTYQLLLRASSFATARLPSLRLLQQAGGRLPQSQVDAVVAAQPQARLFVMYGATEATSRMSYLPPELHDERSGSVGRGIPGVSLIVVDENGEDLPPGSVGELFARGDNITRGYWNDPEGTAERFVDGGLLTGDLGYADADGFVYIVDRKADFIKSWGIRISSHEIEDAVVSMPGVTAAAAVGRPDEAAGEAVVVFYVSSDVTPAQVLAHCRATMARHLVPDEARPIAQLPLNRNGKVVKSELKAMAATVTETRS